MENSANESFGLLEKFIKHDNIEGKVFSFDDPEQGKSTRLRINKVNRVLGSGDYSKWVAEVNVGLENDAGSEKKTHTMVIKRYQDEGVDATKDFIKSYKNYKAIYKAGIPTWDTYRINEENKLALMTLGAKEGQILITANDYRDRPEMEMFKLNPVKQIQNLDEFIARISMIFKKASLHGFRLRTDMYGLVFKPQGNKAGVYELDVLISDLDGLDVSTDPYYIAHYGDKIKETWEKENKDNLGNALWCIFPGTADQKREFEESIMRRL